MIWSDPSGPSCESVRLSGFTRCIFHHLLVFLLNYIFSFFQISYTNRQYSCAALMWYLDLCLFWANRNPSLAVVFTPRCSTVHCVLSFFSSSFFLELFVPRLVNFPSKHHFSSDRVVHLLHFMLVQTAELLRAPVFYGGDCPLKPIAASTQLSMMSPGPHWRGAVAGAEARQA